MQLLWRSAYMSPIGVCGVEASSRQSAPEATKGCLRHHVLVTLRLRSDELTPVPVILRLGHDELIHRHDEPIHIQVILFQRHNELIHLLVTFRLRRDELFHRHDELIHVSVILRLRIDGLIQRRRRRGGGGRSLRKHY